MSGSDNIYDIAIVGGGIVGTTLAAALKDTGIKIAIIEAQATEIGVSRRQSYALSIMSGKIFQGVGVWDDIFPHVGKFSNIKLSDNDYPTYVPFIKEELQTDYLGYVGEHHTILGALQSFTAEKENIDWLCPASVIEVVYTPDDARITVEIDGKIQQLKAKLVVGADGAKSQIRQWAGIKTRGWKYWQSCVTFTLKHNLPSNDTAFERFCATGPMGILPLPDDRFQIVWTAPHDTAQNLQASGEAEFMAQLHQHTGGVLGSVRLVSPRVLFPVQLMQCDRYIASRLALIGDAAHCCHPVGGQGLNLGIRDAAALAQVLMEATKEGQDIGQVKVLKQYEQWRKRENLAILGFTDLLDRMFSSHWLPLIIIRRVGLNMMRHIPPLKRFALKVMTGFKGKIPQLAVRVD
ncbi:MAG: Ubiquinone hydroxylase UbiL [Chroococcopsis gigantea SAG 12.99]|jgi:2-octaprenyl-6-methoxyphenol hydroxylase|nr:FAD-dependent hydroxylase [Chlorogloea purpurea SAG 13.99]MDV3001860.1 Ubiquinone hydroxylase UbiL [Chroococcopsis gigantea SAG 12.99]